MNFHFTFDDYLISSKIFNYFFLKSVIIIFIIEFLKSVLLTSIMITESPLVSISTKLMFKFYDYIHFIGNFDSKNANLGFYLKFLKKSNY